MYPQSVYLPIAFLVVLYTNCIFIFSPGFCLLLTCFIYPGGWDVPEVKAICGQNAASYKTGNCEIRWAFGIAIIAMFDAFILALLSYFFIEKKVVSTSRTLDPAKGQLKQMNGGAAPPPRQPGGIIEEEENTQL